MGGGYAGARGLARGLAHGRAGARLGAAGGSVGWCADARGQGKGRLGVDNAVLLTRGVAGGLRGLVAEGRLDAERGVTGEVVGAAARLANAGGVAPDDYIGTQRVSRAVCDIRLGTYELASRLVEGDELSVGDGCRCSEENSDGLHVGGG